MCLGACLWSGVRRVVCAARDEDARAAVGFDEGPKPQNWQAELNARGVDVQIDCLRDEAVAVLQQYKAQGGPLFGPSNSL